MKKPVKILPLRKNTKIDETLRDIAHWESEIRRSRADLATTEDHIRAIRAARENHRPFDASRLPLLIQLASSHERCIQTAQVCLEDSRRMLAELRGSVRLTGTR